MAPAEDRNFAAARAERLHEEGMAQSQNGDEDGALKAYESALALDPLRPNTHYNIGLIHKYRGDWAKSLEHSLRAFELRPDDEATCWNLAIAATALGDLELANRAWRRCGYDPDAWAAVPPEDRRSTVVRLNPDGAAETVWASVIDAVRAQIDNVPFAASGFRHGDIVLHDGAPTGERLSNGRTFSVFNVLALLQRSDHQTWTARVSAPSEADVEALLVSGRAAGLATEHWTATTRYLCRACSEGTPHEHQDSHLQETSVWSSEREVAFSGRSRATVDTVLAGWLELPGRALIDLTEPPED